MTLLLGESDVSQLVTMRDAVDSVERCFLEMKPGAFANSPRNRSIVEGTVLSAMHASLRYLGRGGAKVYLSTKNGGQFVFLLFDLRTGRPLAVMGADVLGRYRTGAVSAVATKHLGRLRSFVLGLAGTGKQALTQVTALKEIATLEKVRIWSPDLTHREAFSKLLSREHGLDSDGAKSLEDAIRGADVLTTITSCRIPFIRAKHLEDVTHMNACGSNWPDRAEVAPDGIAIFDTICVDDLADSKIESGDLILAAKEGRFEWSNAVELRNVVQSNVRIGARTLFKSNGVAVEDVALASLLYDSATKEGGQEEFDFGPSSKSS